MTRLISRSAKNSLEYSAQAVENTVSAAYCYRNTSNDRIN